MWTLNHIWQISRSCFLDVLWYIHEDMSWGVNEQWLRSMPYPLFHWMIHWLRTVKYWKHQGTMCPSTSSCWQTWSAGKIPPLCSRIVPFKPPFIGIIPMFFQWFSHDVTIQTSIDREFSYIVFICAILIPMIFPWFSQDFPMIFPWFSHDVPMMFLWKASFQQGFPGLPGLPGLPVPGPAAAWALAPGSSSHGPTSQPAGGAQADLNM